MEAAASHMGTKTTSKKDDGVNKSILELFSDIGAPAESKRNESCIALIQHLSEISEQETDESTSNSLTYSLKRLIRGLGAVKQPVQKGYFAALVCVLDSFPSISCETFIKVVEKELGCSKSASKGEEGEAMMGKVLAYGAAIRGGLFSRSSSDDQKLILTSLLKCGHKKMYIPFASSSFIRDLLIISNESTVAEIIWPLLKDEVSKPWEDQSLDSLMFLLSVSSRFPGVVKNKMVSKWLGFPLLSSESMQHFAQRLVSASTSLNIKHPIYDEFCFSLCLPHNQTLFETFWSVNIDSLLATPSIIKDHAVLQLLSIVLSSVNEKQITYLVTPRILEVIGRTLRGSPNIKGHKKFQEAHSRAKQVMSSLSNALTTDNVSDEVRLFVLKKIYFDSGNIQYEKQTGTHITILLESKLSKKAVHKLAKQFREVVDGIPRANGQVWTNSDRKYAVQQLQRLIGHQACNDDIKWKVEQLLYLLERGVLRQDTSSSIGVELAGAVRQSFFRALDQKFSNIEMMVSVLSQLVKHINNILSNKKATKTLRIPFTSEAFASWQKMMLTNSELEKKNASDNRKESAEKIFHILFLFMGLHLISDPSMAQGALQELHSCYDRVKDGKRTSKQSEEPQWVEVTIDLFLSLLSHDSHLLRTVVSTVFPHLSKHLTVSAFYQILEVLDPSQNENPLSSLKGDSDESDSDSDTSSDPGGSSKAHKLKTVNGKSMNSEGESSDEDHSEVESDDDGEEEEEDGEEDDSDEEEEETDSDMEDPDGEETINDKLRLEVRMALGNAASLTDTESVDADDIDEEEGQRMDKALAQAFKTLQQSRNPKKSKKQLKSEEALTHFRNRVLDLVELYVSKEPSMQICLESITPLLSLLAFCMKDIHQKPLETKTRSVLRKLTCQKKFSSVEDVEESSLADQIKSLAGKGSRSATIFLGLSDVISDCCTFLVRCSELVRSQSAKPIGLHPVANVYEDMLLDFCTKRETLLPVNMFRSVISLQWSGCWNLAPLLVKHAFDYNVRPFRRGQAIDLLSIFFRNNHLLKSADKKQQQSLKEIVSSIDNHIVELLKSFIEDPHKVQPQNCRHLASVLRLLLQLLRRPETKLSKKSSLSSTLESFCQNSPGVPAELKNALKSLSKVLGFNTGDLNKKHLDNVHVVNGTNEDTVTKSKLKKNSQRDITANGPSGDEEMSTILKKPQINPKGKNKKAKKLRQIALMGEGLDSVTFTSVNDNMLNGMEPDDDSESEDLSPSKNGAKVNGYVTHTEPSQTKRKTKASIPEDTQIARKKKKIN